MSVTATDTPFIFAGNGATTVFDAPLVSGGATDLFVQLFDALDAATTLALGVDYTYSTATGRVTLAVAPAEGTTLVVGRAIPITQPRSLAPLARLPAGELEAGLDRLTLICQDLNSVLSRTLRVPVVGAGASAAFPPFRPNQLIGWGGEGLLENKDPDLGVPVDPDTGAIAQSAGGTGAITLGGGLVTPTGGNVAATLENILGDRLTARSRGVVPAVAAGDIRASLSAALTALPDGGTLYVPAGTYWIDSADNINRAVNIVGEKSFRVECAPGAVFKAGPNLNTALSATGGRSVFRFESGLSVASERRVEWLGGKVDMSLLPSAPGVGVDAFSTNRVNPFYTGVVVDHGVTTASGANIGVGGGDSSWFAKEFLQAAWVDCASFGAPDLAIYLSGDAGKVARGARIAGLRAYRCAAVVGVKRHASHIHITDPDWFECGTGVFSGQTELLNDHGQSITIAGGSIIKTQGDPIRFENASHCVVSGVRVLDYGRHISDGATATNVSSLNRFGAVKLLGAKHCTVDGNSFGFRDWTAPTVSTREAYAVRLGGYTRSDTTVVTSENNSITGNTFVGAYGGYLADAQTAANLLGRATRVNIANPDFVAGTGNLREDLQTVVPNLAGSGGNLAGAAYDLRQAAIHHDGRTVTVTVYLDLNALTGLNGTVTLTSSNFPVAASGLEQWQGVLTCTGVTGTAFACAIDAGTSAILLYALGPGTRTALTHSDFTSAARLGASITYQVA